MRELDRRYLLRVWREEEGNDAMRLSLRDVLDGSVNTFSDPEGLLRFLRCLPGAAGAGASAGHDPITPSTGPVDPERGVP